MDCSKDMIKYFGRISVKIGIPGGLLYYSYYPLYKTFFEELGAEVICSGNTNKTILDYGVKSCVDEACLPVKIFHGHVESLKNRADALFIPRIISISRNEYICPKFCGLPEMIKNSIKDLPCMIETVVNLRKHKSAIIDSIMDAGSLVTDNRRLIRHAYESALKNQKKFEDGLKRNPDFEKALVNESKEPAVETKKIALIGHPYNLYDSYSNMSILNKLKKLGYDVITPEMVDAKDVELNAAALPKRHFWTFGKRIVGSGMSLLKSGRVEGIIYLSSFGCGIDSLMEDYLARQVRRDGRVPYMKLVLDEHSGEAGLDTRLEAFIDMVRWREENEAGVSPYGRSMHCSKSLS